MPRVKINMSRSQWLKIADWLDENDGCLIARSIRKEVGCGKPSTIRSLEIEEGVRLDLIKEAANACGFSFEED